ncbi:MAG: NUDIX domain-containing protein [Patescibacteria group bacterium]|nr:NUDIX domain-containing protein [Patescibacteria group bacterium]
MMESFKKKTAEENYEREVSSGIVIFRIFEDGPRFLLLYRGNHRWSFPRGKIEEGEKTFSAALREVKEETGLRRSDLRFIGYFKAYENFSFIREGKRVFKTVILYLAESLKDYVRLSREHKGYGWFSYREALRFFPKEKYTDTRRVLKKANDYIAANYRPLS